MTEVVVDDTAQRNDLIAIKEGLRAGVAALTQESKKHPTDSPERQRIYREVQANIAEQDRLEELLEKCFIPQHSATQLISPRAFFASPLFRVCSKRLPRQKEVNLELRGPGGVKVFSYAGPELRQSDGLVFMALLSLVRDTKAGEPVYFTAEDLCRSVFGRYDGPARAALKDHIKRLQRGLIEFDQLSVQLCQRFEYPAKGRWKVALDRDIVTLFKHSAQVWLDLQKRLALPEGLATWLYAFIESQSRLIPTSVESIRNMCGSDAAEESFLRTLRLALKELNQQGVLDEGWFIQKGLVHWRKPSAG